MDTSRAENVKPKEISQKITLNLSPEKAVKDYFLTKFEDRLVKKKPEWDVPRVTPTTELVESRRDLQTANKALKHKREEHRKRKFLIDREWEELEQKQILLQDSYSKFNKFVKENQAKRERAALRIAEEQVLQHKKEEEMQDLKDRTSKLEEIKQSMGEYVQKYKIYEVFLNEVIQHKKEMNSINDILNRYETLSTTRNDLAERQQHDLSTLEDARNEMIKITEEKSQVMLGLMNELSELESRYQKARTESLRWESALCRVKDLSAQKALELEQVAISCWSLYTSMCQRKSIPIDIDKSDIEQQLVFIKRSIMEAKRVIKLVKKKVAKEISTSKPDTSKVPSKEF